MAVIETNHVAALEWAVTRRWLEPETGLVARMQTHLASLRAHPARTLILLPYAQLMPVARRMWSIAAPSGFVPCFETTVTWARSVGAVALDAQGIRFDRGRDLLTAQALLERAGLAAYSDVLTSRLLDAGYSAAPLVAAVRPEHRAAWGDQARLAVQVGLDGVALALESAVARVGLEWALASTYSTDLLFGQLDSDQWDCLLVLQGFQAEPLTLALLEAAGDRGRSLSLLGQGASSVVHAPQLHPALDPEDEAQRAAACVLAHIEAGRVPVALAATDRVLTRRISAMLQVQGAATRDETGWKLSTTRAASRCMAWLRACRWDASCDQILDALKHAPAVAQDQVSALERLLRRHGISRWRLLEADNAVNRLAADARNLPQMQCLVTQVTGLRASMAAARPLSQWLTTLAQLLSDVGVWDGLMTDAAGARVVATLRLGQGAQTEFDDLPQARRRLSLAQFTAWVDEVMEATSFVPDAVQGEQVVVLPLSQLLARPFAALVVPGCDEQRLNPSPEPPGDWTAAQRLALGLPSREALALSFRAAWLDALTVPCVDVLWRVQDEMGEPVLPSPLVQALRLVTTTKTVPPADARTMRSVLTMATTAPRATGSDLPIPPLSATAYDDLRKCPYRFFALRQLGLQSQDELESEIDKRDFGLWLHEVLKAFHDGLKADPVNGRDERVCRLDHAAREVSDKLALDAAEFLPFQAAWPMVRDGYLAWLSDHEATGARYDQGEVSLRQPLASWTLIGTIDRIDRAPDGSVMLMDYKTEPEATTRARVADPYEDTQLAFYASLQHDDTLRAAYVNIAEKGGSKTYENERVVQVRDALIEGLMDDLQRIESGHPLLALGEGATCEYCAARGLCRKDFWQ